MVEEAKGKKPLPEEQRAQAPDDMPRRKFLRLGLALPFVSASLFLPTSLLAARVRPRLCVPVAGQGDVPTHKPKPPRLLMIDPGHGGRDPGAIGLTGTKEKDVVLDIGRRMAHLVSGVPGVQAQLTRDRDEFLSLGTRVKKAQKARADFFLSIHADSAPNHGARGLSAYTLSEKASDKFASMLAARENEADLIGGMDLSEDKEVANILFDLTARHTRNTAQRVKVGFIKGMGRRWQLLEQPMRSANFAVLRVPDVPAMLVETGFLSNRKDESILRKKAQRQKIAQLMVDELSFLLQSALFG